MMKSKAAYDPYSDMPKTVRIGHTMYRIAVMSGLDQDNERIWGDMSNSLQRIRLAPNMPPERLANTFLHEVIHAIHYFLGVDNDSTEEFCTNQTANGLCMFWQDNPEAGAWWAKVNAMQSYKDE